MANKYIRHGETYCGDGTSSAAAASNGAAGAWNNINVLEGSSPAYGSAPAAGDVVYIRSKDNTGANITRTVSATTIGSSAGTASNPVTWVVDGGTIWSGINGVLTYTSNNSYLNTREFNHFIAEVQDALVLAETNTWPSGITFTHKGRLVNAKITSADVNSGNAVITLTTPTNSAHQPAVIENGNFVFARCVGGRISCEGGNQGAAGRLVNPTIEINSSGSGQYLFRMLGDYGRSYIEVIGGRVTGIGATSATTLVQVSNGHGCGFRAIGFDVPKSMPVSNYGLASNSSIELLAPDTNIGSHLEEKWGWATSRTDNNPPALSAQLPNSTLSTWAWRVYPRAADYASPVRLPGVKLFVDTAAIKTITLELLVATTMSPTAKHAWITVEYIDDATGLMKHMSTWDLTGGSLSSSSAAWSFTSWGMISFNKRKIAVTTPTAIKKDTPVTVVFWYAQASASDQDILFVDPDFSLT